MTTLNNEQWVRIKQMLDLELEERQNDLKNVMMEHPSERTGEDQRLEADIILLQSIYGALAKGD